MDVGMADAAIEHIDQHVARADRTAGNVHRLQRTRCTVRTIGSSGKGAGADWRIPGCSLGACGRSGHQRRRDQGRGRFQDVTSAVEGRIFLLHGVVTFVAYG